LDSDPELCLKERILSIETSSTDISTDSMDSGLDTGLDTGFDHAENELGGLNPSANSTEPLDHKEDIDLDDDSDDGDLRSTSTRSQWSASDMDDEEEAADVSGELRADAASLEGALDKGDSKRRGMEEETEEDDVDLDQIEDILALPEEQFPRFTLAKNKARFLRMVSWYKNKKEWLEVAPLSGVSKLFKQQTKELVGIRASKLDYEMELETGTLTPSQRSYRRDELKMCKVHEKMAVNLIARMQVKIKSGRR
jgi:hypothetical protein